MWVDQPHPRVKEGRSRREVEVNLPGEALHAVPFVEAQDRLAKGQGQYVNHIYGLKEVGGTSVLLLSSVPFENFGYRTDLGSEPLPLLTYGVLSHLPDVVSIGAVVLGGIWWLCNRKEDVAAAEGREAPSKA